MPKSKATSIDVARAAGVSQSSVSRAFQPGVRVRPEIMAKIQKAAEELGYVPNKIARAMTSGKSYAIGVVVASLDNPFYSQAIELLSNELRPLGYHIVLFPATNAEAGVDDIIEELMVQRVDGIILASISTTLTLTEKIHKADIPCVLFNRGQADGPLPMITAGNFLGGKRAAEHLLETGHQHIAHIAGWRGSQTGLDRINGFLAGMKDHTDKLIGVVDCNFDRNKAIRLTKEMFANNDKPDGLFVGNDQMAFAVIEALRHDLQLDVPGDVSVIGFDDVPMAAWRDFDLTTFRQPINRMVDACVKSLMTMIRGDDPESLDIVIESDLIIRGSTKNRNEKPDE